MDALQLAAVSRAHCALTAALAVDPVIDRGQVQAARAKAFVDLGYAFLRARDADEGLRNAQNHKSEAVRKAAANTIVPGDVWNAADAQALAAAFVASIAEQSLIDSIAKYARPIPTNVGDVLVASGWAAGGIDEAAPKVVRQQGLSGDATPSLKAAAIIVQTAELARATGDAGRALFERELRAAVVRGGNDAVLGYLVTSGTTSITGTGDALAKLRAGMAAAGPSDGFVVAASAGVVADLATRTENRGGMGIRGGTFVPGVDVVAHDDLDNIIVIPASRLAIADYGLRLAPSGEASVDMADSPTSPSQLVSLFQANCRALLGERMFRIGGDTSGVVVVA